MKISTKNASILIDVINKQLEITRLKIQNTDDLLEQNHLIILQGLRNEFENHFFNQTIDRKDKQK
jgi:hypothetical protein|tara:strand:- start:90 stop:284 length:195 start_codon:yes stop_codon:yes gene_type:complete